LKGPENMTKEEMYAANIFPLLRGRADKFPEGESEDDVAIRAERVLQECIMPFVWKAARSGVWGDHIAIVSHGLCISELIAALVRKNAEKRPERSYKGMLNTGWTSVVVSIKDGKEGEVMDFTDSNPPPLLVRVAHINQHEHIRDMIRQKDGSEAYDAQVETIPLRRSISW